MLYGLSPFDTEILLLQRGQGGLLTPQWQEYGFYLLKQQKVEEFSLKVMLNTASHVLEIKIV